MAKQARKRFKPSMRQRKRYLVVVMQGKLNFSLLKKVIAGKCDAEVKLIGFNDKKSKVMVCVLRKHLEKIREALKDAGFNCIGVSGTIKRARMKWG